MWHRQICVAAHERFGELLNRVNAAYEQMRSLSCDEVGNAFRVDIAERPETQLRVNRGLMYRVFAQLADPAD